MKLIIREEISIGSFGFNEAAMPYFFSSGYESLIASFNKDKYLLFYSEKLSALMPVCKYHVKAFALLQVIYPPVGLNNNRLSAKDEKEFLNDFVALVKKQKLGIRIVQSYSYCVFNAVPGGSVSCPFGTYTIDLYKHTEDELFAHIDPKGRNKIRNAQKNGVELKWGNECIDDFYTLYKDTMQRSKLNVDGIEHFKQMINSLNGSILCGVSYLNGKPQAALFMPYTTYCGCYLHGAMAAKMDNPGAMDYLQWEAIRILKSKGVKQYDFVGARLSNVTGTKLEGIQNFKKKFGGELVQGYLWKMDIDAMQCALFDGLLKVNRTLKGTKKHVDIIDEELEKVGK